MVRRSGGDLGRKIKLLYCRGKRTNNAISSQTVLGMWRLRSIYMHEMWFRILLCAMLPRAYRYKMSEVHHVSFLIKSKDGSKTIMMVQRVCLMATYPMHHSRVWEYSMCMHVRAVG